jgi:hypothetical protein
VEAIGIGVAVAVISAAIIAAARVSWRHREAARQEVRERACRHEWEPIDKPGDSVVLVTGDSEWCVRCGARR